MLSVGEKLKRARLKQGLDLSAVAAQTKISARYLEAIESDNRKILPSGFFYKSFVEQYAAFLSLDTPEIDAEIDRVLSADEPLPLPGFGSVVTRNVPPVGSFHKRPSYKAAVSLVLVLAGCAGVYAWWHSGGAVSRLRGMVDQVTAFAKLSVAPSKPVGSANTVKPTPLVIGSRVQPQAIASVKPPPINVPAPETAAPVSVTSSAKPDEADAKATPDYKVMVDLMAREATWLSVSSDGKPVFSGILQANQTKSVGGKQFAKMRVGNAAALEVRLNGKLLAPLGARGQVLVVLFTPDNFQIVSPPKESD
jgi:cytoskeletal protein RodZ